MIKTLTVKIILPSKISLEQEATMVNIPGSKGVFGVLPGHAKLVASMDVGVVTLFDDEMETKYFVYGGIAQVTGQELNIITEFASNLESTPAKSVYDDIARLKNDLSKLDDDSIEAEIISNNIEIYHSLLKFIEVK